LSRALAAVALAAVALAGCGDDTNAFVPPHPDLSVPADLATIDDLALTSAGVVMVGPGAKNVFAPATVTIAAGQSVTWNWISGTHSIESDDTPAAFDASPLLSAGQYTVPFPTAGTYGYHCGVHGTMMTGTIVVQ
jgi:plastocyanin